MLCQLNNSYPPWAIQNVQSTPQNNANFIVSIVTFQFVQAVFPLKNILDTMQ